MRVYCTRCLGKNMEFLAREYLADNTAKDHYRCKDCYHLTEDHRLLRDYQQTELETVEDALSAEVTSAKPKQLPLFVVRRDDR